MCKVAETHVKFTFASKVTLIFNLVKNLISLRVNLMRFAELLIDWRRCSVFSRAECVCVVCFPMLRAENM